LKKTWTTARSWEEHSAKDKQKKKVFLLEKRDRGAMLVKQDFGPRGTKFERFRERTCSHYPVPDERGVGEKKGVNRM